MMTDERLSRRALLRAAASGAILAASGLAGAIGAAPPRFLLQWGKRGKAEGEFDIPIGIAIDRRGRRDEVYVTEFRNNRVQKFDSNGLLLHVLSLTGEMPSGIAVDRDGNIYVAHLMAGKISVYDAEGKPLREIGKPGPGDGELQQPGGLAVARDGSIYVADEVNHRIQQFTAKGEFIRKWGEYGNEVGQFGGRDNRANRTGGPQFVALDGRGSVYTTEAANGRIQKFTPDGKYLASWGDNSTGPGGFGGRPKNLPGPIAIVIDSHGRAWVSSTNHRVQEFTAEGRYLRMMGGQGAEPGQFSTPHGLAFDSRGCLYVCDTQNARIQKFKP